MTHPLNESQWVKGHFIVQEWESEKHKSWGLQAGGFRDRVATNVSVGSHRKMGACDWSVLQLDHDEESGDDARDVWNVDVELEVQRTIKRAEFTAFL